ncbi:storkhead-box protein 1 [Discoglossus pictus]
MHMSPVSQSQFVPLAEVLCCAISDMNTAQVLVTQETLIEHLISHYPGIATPSKDILYNALGNLIKERKIYHTGEGYFIVTPQTYFITKTPVLGSAVVAMADDLHSPPSITYLVSMESCADLTKENAPSMSHCRSCSCFSELSAQNILGQQSINESNVKGHRSFKESKPLVHNQATSTAMDRFTRAKPKEKDKCTKKFGISLFWRNPTRKEKSTKQLVNFSSQFPPEEWPVRDEDNLDNIPRDIEHEIIKRINPVLTVDNLIKHTVMMQKADTQKKYFSKGTSTDIVKNKHRHSVRGSSRKKSSKISRYQKSIKEKSKKETLVPRAEISTHGHGDGLSLQRIVAVDDLMVQELQPDLVYKKQISNPFIGISYRESNKGVKRGEMKRSSSGKHRKRSSGLVERPGAVPVDISVKYPNEGYMDGYNNEDLFHDPVPEKDDLTEYPPNYPQCTTLPIDEKYQQNKKNNAAHKHHGEDGDSGDHPGKTLEQSECLQEYKEAGSHSMWTYTNKIRPIPSGSQSSQVNHCKNVTVLKHIIHPHIEDSEKSVKHGSYSVTGLNCENIPKYKAFINSENEGLTDDDHTLYQKAAEDDDDVCSSLYLEDDTDENIDVGPTLQKTSREQLAWTDTQEENQGESEHSHDNWSPELSLMSQFTCVDHHKESYNASGSSVSSSLKYEKPALHPKGCSTQLLPRYDHNHQEVETDTKCTPVSETVDGSIFDYGHSSDGNSMAEALQMSGSGNDEKRVGRDSEPQSGEMRKCFEHKLKLFNPLDTNYCEKIESHSTTGDSGIESPRTRISLASSNSIIMERLKRRTFLHNLEMQSNSKNEALLPSGLMQRTPVMHV